MEEIRERIIYKVNIENDFFIIIINLNRKNMIGNKHFYFPSFVSRLLIQ